MEKIIPTSNLPRTNINPRLVLVLLVYFLINACGTRGKYSEQREPILYDSLQVALYDFNSADFDAMYRVLVDTCSVRYSCQNIDFIRLGISPRKDSIEFWFSNGGNPFGYKFSKELAVFIVNNTVVWVDKQVIDTLTFFSTAVFQNKIILNTELKHPYNECLYIQEGEDFNKILIHMSFLKREAYPPEFKGFMELIE
ncbi:MAG: hypothetical protein DHS20C18_29390 [Saprospiraceae bacterium]|nr:MAG: hypothetical protein DHS20C18_29390 [Saprospiraceae bacterium]